MPCHDSAVHNAGFMDVVASHVDFVLAAIRLLYADCTVPLIGPLAIPSAVGVHALALALNLRLHATNGRPRRSCVAATCARCAGGTARALLQEVRLSQVDELDAPRGAELGALPDDALHHCGTSQ